MFCVLLLASMATSKAAASAYFADFSAFNHELDRQPTCVAIPSNMTLCNNIGYTKMRLPNLLKHDTIQEASQQASYWQGLSQVRCAEDSQLFLCSLFAPVSEFNLVLSGHNYPTLLFSGLPREADLPLQVIVSKGQSGVRGHPEGPRVPLASDASLRQLPPRQRHVHHVTGRGQTRSRRRRG